MFLRSLLAAAIALVAASIAAPQAAEAWSSKTSVALVIRDGPGTTYGRLTVVPAGATVEVYKCAGWCEVLYMGCRGYAYAKYVSSRYRYAPLNQTLYLSPVRTPRGTVMSPVYVPPQTAYLASAPIRLPSIERADWYQGRAFYYNGRFINRPDLFFIYGR